MATSATMTFTDQVGKQSTKAITYVNPNATPANVAKYVAGLNALTDNTLDGNGFNYALRIAHY